MRNLKKVLSLVLCLAMMLSIMVVGAGAAFTDQDQFDADYTEAAEVLTGLGVLQGYPDGSFLPKGNITRAQVAAVIYRVVTGDVSDKQTSIYADYNKFSDVQAADWHAGYVNFCGNAELIKGFGDGTFGPNKNVTGYQALAMILRAVGYDQNGEFTGPGWEIRTASIAEDMGILKNVQKETLGAPATRELVAELIFQAIIVPTVKYTPALGYQTTTGKVTNPTLGEKEFDLSKVEGVIVANEAANLGSDTANALKAGKTQLDNGKTYNLSTDISIIGEKVTFWVTDGEDAVSTPISKAKVTDWSNLAEAELTKDQVKDWDKNSKGAEIYYNYDKAPAFDLFDKGITVKAIDNDGDGDYEYVLAEKQTLAKIKTIATDGVITLNNVKSVGDQVVYSNAKVGDVVLVISYDGATYIEKAASINGIVSGYSTKGDIPTAKIGSKDYAISAIENTVSGLNTFDDVKDTYLPGDDWNGKYYTYYQDAYGNIIAYEVAGENATDYALILDYDVYKTGAFQGDLTWRPLDGFNKGDVYVKYLTVDNEVETAKLDVDGKYIVANAMGIIDTSKLAVGDVVSYNINSDGEFSVVATYAYEDTTVETDADKGLARVGDEPELYNVDGDLVVFYYLDAEVIGQYANTDDDALAKSLYEALGYYLPVGPVYGVLTGEDAIADLDGAREYVHQMDATENPSSNHTNKYDGDAAMFNIRGIIDPFVDFCYIRDVNKYTEEQVDNAYYRTYNAINSQGDPIEVVTRQWGFVDEADVFAYLTVDVNGETVNILADVGEQYLMRGDIHQGNGGIEVYEETDCVGKLIEAPEVYADVTTDKGGTTNVSKDYCTTGIVVTLDGETAEAVFVTDTCDNEIDYVDVNVDKDPGMDKHLKIGDTYSFTGCLKVGDEIVAHKGEVAKVAADWDGKTIVDVTPYCDKCAPVITYAAKVESAKFIPNEGATITLSAHKYINGVEDTTHTVHNATAVVSIYNAQGNLVQTTENVSGTVTPSGITVPTTTQLTTGASYYAVVTLTCNGQTYPAVQTPLIEAQPSV